MSVDIISNAEMVLRFRMERSINAVLCSGHSKVPQTESFL